MPFTAGGREGRYGFDFSREHLHALHRVSQIDDVGPKDYVVVGTAITDRAFESDRVVDLNVLWVMKIGRSDYVA